MSVSFCTSFLVVAICICVIARHLSRFFFDSSFSEIEIEEFSGFDTEGALIGIEPHFMFANLGEHFCQIGGVVGFERTFDDHVVHVDFQHASNLESEIIVHHPLERGRGVLELEGHSR